MKILQTSEFTRTSKNWLLIVGLVLTAVLFFIWPIPRTTSSRDLLLIVCLGLFAYLVYRSGCSPIWGRSLRVPFGLYLLLSVWIVFVAIVISEETAWSLNEIRSQWLKATIALIVGGLLGATIQDDDNAIRLALTIIGVALLLHVLYIAHQALGIWPQQKIMAARAIGLTAGSDKSNYLTNMLLYFLLAEIITRLVFHRRFLPVGSILLMAFTMITLFTVYAEAVRNGFIELIVVLGLAITLVMRKSDRVHRLVVAGTAFALLAIVLVLGYLSMHKDERWQTFIETVPIALDTGKEKAWINEALPQPRLADGKMVDWSNYMRLARIKAGAELILEYPWGVGFGRNAFGHAVMDKYGESSSHSHSGLIDLAIGTGIPGMLLWVGFLAGLVTLAWQSFQRTRDYCALTLLFLVTGYSTRMLLDSITRDHMLQMFLFLASFLAVIVAGRLARQRRLTAAPPG